MIDRFEVSYAPSAAQLGACRQRAQERAEHTTTLVAIANPDLGDPLLDLPGAEAEVAEITQIVGEAKATTAKRAGATKRFLAGNAGRATHLHLACHASGALFDPDEAVLHLSDGALPALELGSAGLEARLTVISACEAAVPDISKLNDEAISLGTAYLAAGSACVVASLWSVDDCATALLMTKFYEFLIERGETPRAALRQAQLWLRDLTEADESAFLATHPALAAEFKRRREADHPPGGRRGSSAPAALGLGRYAHPLYWAPFVVAGA